MDTKATTALLMALRLAEEHGGAEAALSAAGVDLGAVEPYHELPGSGDPEILALGFLAGHVAQRPEQGARTALADPSAFLMDPELLVKDAQGGSILRLPWFDEELFVGRQLPDIQEMPKPVLSVCIDNYVAALGGERRRFGFTSYGHSYKVDAVPVRGGGGRVDGVLAVATPERCHTPAAATYDRVAEELEASAAEAERRAQLHARAERASDALAESRVAESTRRAAKRARAQARLLRERDPRRSDPARQLVTAREAEVLTLASHGLTSAAIADQLSISLATVRTHLENVRDKLGVSDKAAAVAAALRHGLIE